MPSNDRPSTSELLGALSEWERADGALLENATVREEFAADVEMEIERRLTVEESRSTGWVPASTYERWTEERVPLEGRYSEAPDDVSERTVTFVEMGRSPQECPHCEGDRVETCTQCDGDGTTQCRECSGAGANDCPECEGAGAFRCTSCKGGKTEDCDNCRGSGTITNTHEEPCSRCPGASGTIGCPDCAGEGEDDCETCDGEGVVACPDCERTGTETHSETEPCPDCSGEGTQPCSDCGGTGTNSCGNCGGDGTVRCQNCRGDGRVTCSKCDGEETITCTVCDGDGEAVKATSGELRFRTKTLATTDTETVPSELFRKDDGTRQETRQVDPENRAESGEQAVYRRKSELRTVPTKYVEYTHSGTRYDVGYVDGEVRTSDYPRSAGHLREQIESARERERFELGSSRSLGDTATAAIKRFVLDSGTIVGATAVLLVFSIVVALLTSLLPLGSTLTDVVGLGIPALVSLWMAKQWQGTLGTEISTTSYGGGLIGGVALLGIAAALVGGNVWSQPAQLMAVTFAAAFWSSRVSQRLVFEDRRISFTKRERESFIEEMDGRRNELREYDLEHLLPDEDQPLDDGTFTDAGAAVFTACWGLSAFYLTVLVLSNVGDGFVLFEFLTFGQSLLLPIALAGLAAASCGLLVLRRMRA